MAEVLAPPVELLGQGVGHPFLFTAEHAGAALPEGVHLAEEERALLSRHWGVDLGVRWVTAALVERLGGRAVLGVYSRLWIDLNRGEYEPSLCPEQVEGRPLSINAGITREEKSRRVALFHTPYHEAIDREIRSARAVGVTPLLLSVHSFTPEPLGGSDRSFDLGVLFDDHEGQARELAWHLSTVGFRTRLNEPYSGQLGLIYAARRHGQRLGVTYLELEINQALLPTQHEARAVALRIARGLARWQRLPDVSR